MKCPICHYESEEAFCPQCGYHLEWDQRMHTLLHRLSDEEIAEYQYQQDQYRERYQQNLYSDSSDDWQEKYNQLKENMDQRISRLANKNKRLKDKNDQLQHQNDGLQQHSNHYKTVVQYLHQFFIIMCPILTTFILFVTRFILHLMNMDNPYMIMFAHAGISIIATGLIYRVVFNVNQQYCDENNWTIRNYGLIDSRGRWWSKMNCLFFFMPAFMAIDFQPYDYIHYLIIYNCVLMVLMMVNFYDFGFQCSRYFTALLMLIGLAGAIYIMFMYILPVWSLSVSLFYKIIYSLGWLCLAVSYFFAAISMNQEESGFAISSISCLVLAELGVVIAILVNAIKGFF